MNTYSYKKIKTARNSFGFTIAEFVIALAIFVLAAAFMTLAERDLFHFNSFIQANLTAQIQGRRTVTTMVSEMREMTPSSLGSYPIAAAATSSITFYSDIDADTVKEQIKYYVQGKQILKSVINPTGSPLVYNAGSAVVTTAISSILNGTSTPVFQYYDADYSGTTTPLSTPVNISAIKLVKVTIILENKSSNGTDPITVTSQVTMRNLKDNL